MGGQRYLGENIRGASLTGQRTPPTLQIVPDNTNKAALLTAAALYGFSSGRSGLENCYKIHQTSGGERESQTLAQT